LASAKSAKLRRKGSAILVTNLSEWGRGMRKKRFSLPTLLFVCAGKTRGGLEGTKNLKTRGDERKKFIRTQGKSAP